MAVRKAATGERHIDVLKSLKKALQDGLKDASPGVLPQYAKQIADISREIEQIEPAPKEATNIDGFRDAFNGAK